MSILTLTIDYDDKYYLAIALKFGWTAILPNDIINSVTYQEFALNWLKQQIATKILEPEFISFQNNRIEEIRTKISLEAKSVIATGLHIY